MLGLYLEQDKGGAFYKRGKFFKQGREEFQGKAVLVGPSNILL